MDLIAKLSQYIIFFFLIKKIFKTSEDVYFVRFMENKYIFDAEKYNFIRLKPDVHFDLVTLGDKVKS